MKRFSKNIVKLSSIAAVLLVATPVAAQQTLVSDEVLSEDFQDFRGEGLAPGGADGTLDSDVWKIRLSPSIETDFGYTSTEPELSRGVNPGTSGTGGLWAYTIGPDEYALGAQPTGSVFTDGHFETHIINGTGSSLDTIDIAFDFCWLNKRDRSQFFRGQVRYPSGTGMNTSFFFQGATPGPQDDDPQWECERIESTVDLSSSPLMPDATAEIRWFSNDSDGETASGTRDALALNNVLIATTRCGNGIISEGDVCDDGDATGETECPYGVPTCTACNADCSAEIDLTGPFCGDGIVHEDEGEECDPADEDGPECTEECELVDDPDADVGNGGGDAGHDAGNGDDTGVADAGPSDDVGTSDDAGHQADAGTSDDAGHREDAGTSDDAGDQADAGSSLDAGTTDDYPNPDAEAGCGCSTSTTNSPFAPLGWLAIVGLALLKVRRSKAGE